MPNVRTTPTLAIALLLFAGPLGCDDPQATQQTAAVKSLSDATRQFSSITIGIANPGGETFDERRDGLTRLASTVNGIPEPADAPIAGKAMLAASIQRELAALSLAEATEAEVELNRHRRVTGAMIDAATRLHGMAAARDSIDLGDSRAQLDDTRRFALDHRDRYRRVVDELEAPIADSTASIEEEQAIIDDLTRDANTMRRQALELGPSAGFDVFAQAIDRERDADQLAVRIAHRELDLDYELRPEHRIAENEVTAAEELIESIARSESGLDAFIEAVGADTAITRQMVAELAEEVDERVAETRRRMEGDDDDAIAALYARTVDHLDRAARDAAKAARAVPRDQADAARIAEARIHAMLGQTHWARVHGLDDQIELLDGLLGASDVIDGSSYRGWRDELLRRRSEAFDLTRASYEQAQASAGQVSARGGGQALIEYGQSLEAALAALGGETMSMKLSLPSAERPAPRRSPATGANASGGAATHRELIERVLALRDDPDAGDRFFSYCRATTPDARRGLESMKRMTTAMSRLDAAMTDAFGTSGFADMLPGGNVSAPEMSDVTLVSETDDTAMYTYEPAPGTTGNAKAIRVDGAWYFDLESIVPGLAGMGPTMDEQVSLMENAVRELVPRIEAGEFSSAQEAMMAMMPYLTPAGGSGMPARPR